MLLPILLYKAHLRSPHPGSLRTPTLHTPILHSAPSEVRNRCCLQVRPGDLKRNLLDWGCMDNQRLMASRYRFDARLQLTSPTCQALWDQAL
jgi:hypothetical protein